MDLERHPHHRFNPLTREWTLVSPQRDITAEEAAERLRAAAER